MEVKWDTHPNLIKPFSDPTEPIPVVRETTTLSTRVDSTTSRFEVARLISQDTDNSIILRAFYDVDLGINYWVNTVLNLSAIYEVMLLRSPVSLGQTLPIEYYALSGCDGTGKTQCKEAFGSYNETYNVVSSEIVETPLGYFEAYKIAFTNTIVQPLAGNSLLLANFDIRHFCSDNASEITSVNFDGYAWLFPEVGFVKFDFDCVNNLSGAFLRIIASLSNTNFELKVN